MAAKNQVIATQEKLKKSIEETKDIAKDFSRTLTDGLINNKKFVDALGDAFLRLGQRFADSAISTAIDNVFKLRTTSTASNSGSNLFSSLFGGLFGGKGFASGTANTGGMRGEPIGIVHGQEAVIPLPNGGKVPVQIFTGRQETQTKPRLSEPAQRVNLSVHVAPSDMFDVHVREIAQQVSQRNIREYHKNLPNLIGQTINEAQTKNRM